MNIDTEDTRKGLEQAQALRSMVTGYIIPHTPQPDGGILMCVNDDNDTWVCYLDSGAMARPAAEWLLHFPDVVNLAVAIAAERDAAEAKVERLQARLSEVEAERDRLHEALSRWGRWCYSPDGMGGDLFDAAVEGTPNDCFPSEEER